MTVGLFVRRTVCRIALLIWLCIEFACLPATVEAANFPPATARTNSTPSLNDALWSKEDMWGLAAMRQTNGPTYEFFRDLLPPLRYVNATFKYYPIILSAPGSSQKARLVSNGSAINPQAGLKTWKESGFPVTFLVGDGNHVFGEDLRKVEGPTYEKGYLPIVHLSCEYRGAKYEEETFASVDTPSAEHGVVFTQFKLKTGKRGTISAKIEAKTPLTLADDALCNTNGEIMVRFDDKWKWNPASQMLSASLEQGQTAAMMIASQPMPPPSVVVKHWSWGRKRSFNYDQERKSCINRWQNLLDGGMQIEVPETIVNNAWRSLLIGNFIMVAGDKANYSWGNAYARLYEAESGDTVNAFLLWGHTNDAQRMIPPLLDYSLDKLAFHNAGLKLQTLSTYYWLTRDATFVNAMKPRWSKDVSRIANGREAKSGLAPRENYCSDIFQSIYSLNSNASGWRGLRDFSSVLADMGEGDSAKQFAATAKDYRQSILTAVDNSERTDVQPSFIPIAMFGEEKPYDPLTGSMLGSYWNLIAPYVLGSGVLGFDSEREKEMLDYLQEKGGIFMGMIRFHQHSGLFANEDAVDDLYGLRYVTTLLRLDQPDRALVSFYGKLAQGMTRDTFIGAEGTGLKPLDEWGRPMYLPPNSAANSHFLSTLRHLLIQDWDMDDDGKPDTLRLLFATPRQWLRDGQTIRVEHAPTAFGEISFTAHSRLKSGEVVVVIEPPQREAPQEMLLRIRLPDGWQPMAADVVKSRELICTGMLRLEPDGTIHLPASLHGKFTVRVRVQRK
jgi:hypothetical protein